MKLSTDDLVIVYILALLFIALVLGLMCFFLDQCDRYAAKVSAGVAGKLEKPLLFGHSVHPMHATYVPQPQFDADEYSLV